MNFQQTIFMNNANASSASKGKNQSASKNSGNNDFYKIIQGMSSPKDNGNKQINAANPAKTSETNTDYNAKISGDDDLIDENVINEALGVKTSGTQTQTKTEETGGEVKFSAEEVKALASDRKALEEISEMLNIPMEVIEAFISQLALGAMSGETMTSTSEIPAIVNSLAGLYENADASSDESVNLTEELTNEFIEELKKFAETDQSGRTAQKYENLNEFIESVKEGLDLDAAARRAVRINPMPDRLANNADMTDETTEFVTEKILSYLNIDADSLSDFEIVSIEKLLNGNISENDNLAALIQKLRNPFAAVTQQIKAEISAVAATEETQIPVETAEMIPAVNTAEIENVSDETEIPEGYEPVKINGADITDSGMTAVSVSANTPEIKQYPDVITHYTRAANSIQNLIMNNKNGENFQVKMLLRPEGLGEMLVSVTYNKGNINLNVTTDNTLAQRELLNQSAELRTSLAEHDFNLMNFDVGHKNPDDRNQYGGNEKNSKNKRSGKINGMSTEMGADLKISNEDILKLRGIYQNRLLYRQV